MTSLFRHPLWLTILFLFCLSHTVASAADPAPTAVAIIGTGDMGDSLGPRFAELGYAVIYGSRNPDSKRAQALVKQTGHGARITTQKNAAQSAGIVVLAIPWPAMETVAQNLGSLDGKIVIDISTAAKQADVYSPRSSGAPSNSGEQVWGQARYGSVPVRSC